VKGFLKRRWEVKTVEEKEEGKRQITIIRWTISRLTYDKTITLERWRHPGGCMSHNREQQNRRRDRREGKQVRQKKRIVPSRKGGQREREERNTCASVGGRYLNGKKINKMELYRPENRKNTL